MNLKIELITLTVMVIGISNASTISSLVLNIQQRAEDVLRKDTIKSINLESGIISCHDYYSEEFQRLLETYAKDLKRCKDIESGKLVALFTEGQLRRETITKSLNNICASLEECTAESDNLDFFDCVDRSGDKSTRGIWKAARDSSDNAAPIREKIHDIKYETGRCFSEVERVYIIAATEASDDMMLCYSEIEEKDQVEELEKKIQNHNEF